MRNGNIRTNTVEFKGGHLDCLGRTESVVSKRRRTESVQVNDGGEVLGDWDGASGMKDFLGVG